MYYPIYDIKLWLLAGFNFNFSINSGINPIPAGVLENQDILGGGGSIPCLMSKYDERYIIGKLFSSTLRICKKNANLHKFFFLRIPVIYRETLNNEYIERIHQMLYSSISDNGMLQIFSFLIK